MPNAAVELRDIYKSFAKGCGKITSLWKVGCVMILINSDCPPSESPLSGAVRI